MKKTRRKPGGRYTNPKCTHRHFAAPTKIIWILVDASNSNQRSKNYLWWFETRALARSFLEHHRRVYPEGATLIGPFKYLRARPHPHPRPRRPRRR